MAGCFEDHQRCAAGRAVNRPEQDLQASVVAYLFAALPDLPWYAVPNYAGNLGPRIGGLFKRLGKRAGVPDLAFVLPNGSAAFIELKAGKGSLDPAQRDFRDSLPHGALWAEARSLAEVQDILERWLTPFGWNLRARVAA